VTRFPNEITQLELGITRGLVVTQTSEKDFANPETDPSLETYLQRVMGMRLKRTAACGGWWKTRPWARAR
jgi:aromatic ring hydroxylase